MIPRELLENVSGEDWISMIRGNPEISIDDLRLHMNTGRDYTLDSLQIGWLFEVLEEYDQDMRSKFLRFVTGSLILPSGGFRDFRILVVRTNRLGGIRGGQARLPVTHTCFRSMELPEYESLEELRQKLTLAIEIDSAGAMEG